MKTLNLEDFKANTKEWFLEQLGNMPTPQALRTISDLYDELHKPTYPKTSEECCDILKTTYVEWFGYYGEVLVPFQILIICRDAYWKIAGEQMGLGKPWKPDWANDDTLKYCIIVERGFISKQNFRKIQFTLAFPTEKMRDAFHENFKDLIRDCTELL